MPLKQIAPRRTKRIAKPKGNNPTVFKGSVTRSDVERVIYERMELFSEQVRKCDINGILETLDLSNSESQTVESKYIL